MLRRVALILRCHLLLTGPVLESLFRPMETVMVNQLLVQSKVTTASLMAKQLLVQIKVTIASLRVEQFHVQFRVASAMFMEMESRLLLHSG